MSAKDLLQRGFRRLNAFRRASRSSRLSPESREAAKKAAELQRRVNEALAATMIGEASSSVSLPQAGTVIGVRTVGGVPLRGIIEDVSEDGIVHWKTEDGRSHFMAVDDLSQIMTTPPDPSRTTNNATTVPNPPPDLTEPTVPEGACAKYFDPNSARIPVKPCEPTDGVTELARAGSVSGDDWSAWSAEVVRQFNATLFEELGRENARLKRAVRQLETRLEKSIHEQWQLQTDIQSDRDRKNRRDERIMAIGLGGIGAFYFIAVVAVAIGPWWSWGGAIVLAAVVSGVGEESRYQRVTSLIATSILIGAFVVPLATVLLEPLSCHFLSMIRWAAGSVSPYCSIDGQ